MLMPGIPVLRRLREEGCHKLKGQHGLQNKILFQNKQITMLGLNDWWPQTETSKKLKYNALYEISSMLMLYDWPGKE